MKSFMKIPLIIVALLISVLTTSCSTFDKVADSATGELVFQYATIKTISDSDSIDSQEVVDFVDRVMPLIEDSENTVDVLMDIIRSEIRWESLAVEDRLLVNYVFSLAEEKLSERNLLAEDITTSTLTLLSWIKSAAYLAG